MQQATNITGKELIEENAHYVLGMYDLYQNDQEIIDALKLKGLKPVIIDAVMRKVKQPAYEKRIEQAKRAILYGILVALVLLVIAYLLKKLGGTEFTKSDGRAGDGMLQWVFQFYKQFYFYIIVLSLLRAVLGMVSFFKYKKLLQGSEVSG